MSDGEAHASHLAAQTLANMVITRRAAYLDHSGLRPRIQHALIALPIESSKLFARKVLEARLWEPEESIPQALFFRLPQATDLCQEQKPCCGEVACFSYSGYTDKTQCTPSKLRRILAPSSVEVAMRDSVLTLSCPLDSPPMVVSAPSEPVSGRRAAHRLCVTVASHHR